MLFSGNLQVRKLEDTREEELKSNIDGNRQAIFSNLLRLSQSNILDASGNFVMDQGENYILTLQLDILRRQNEVIISQNELLLRLFKGSGEHTHIKSEEAPSILGTAQPPETPRPPTPVIPIQTAPAQVQVLQAVPQQTPGLCLQCKFQNDGMSRFCTKCGTKLR